MKYLLKMANEGDDFFIVDLFILILQVTYGGGIFRFSFRGDILLKNTENNNFISSISHLK